jgi:hypothetical protein
MWILIGTWIYLLLLQSRRITITWNSFCKSFHQQCTGRSLESSSGTNNTNFLPGPTKLLGWLSSWTSTKPSLAGNSHCLDDLLSSEFYLEMIFISVCSLSQLPQSSKLPQGWHPTAASELLLICWSALQTVDQLLPMRSLSPETKSFIEGPQRKHTLPQVVFFYLVHYRGYVPSQAGYHWNAPS